MIGLIYRALPAGTLYFTPDAVRRMLSHRQSKVRSREAGGVLLGRHLKGVEDIVVDAVTEPKLGDRRRWASFFRSCRHNISARRRWAKHDHTSAYLGSWHTHPEPDPQPSAVDIADWQNALERDGYDGTRLFFVIVGTKQLRVWQGHRYGDLIELGFIREHDEKSN
jgi:integrative and conjugative element protein (TIGR02256 family)